MTSSTRDDTRSKIIASLEFALEELDAMDMALPAVKVAEALDQIIEKDDPSDISGAD